MRKTNIGLAVIIILGTASAAAAATRHRTPATPAQCWVDTGQGMNINGSFGHVTSCSEKGSKPMTASPMSAAR